MGVSSRLTNIYLFSTGLGRRCFISFGPVEGWWKEGVLNTAAGYMRPFGCSWENLLGDLGRERSRWHGDGDGIQRKEGVSRSGSELDTFNTSTSTLLFLFCSNSFPPCPLSDILSSAYLTKPSIEFPMPPSWAQSSILSSSWGSLKSLHLDANGCSQP